VETIDPATVMRDERFRTQGVRVDDEGRVHAWVVGLMFVWLPAEMVLPADTPVTFHLTAVDVTHGYQIVRTNGQTMVLPGYVSQFTTQFDAGEYLVACNEYCGLGHHSMAAKIRVVPRGEWSAP
jgi:cytochrome c oxidase subunit 2